MKLHNPTLFYKLQSERGKKGCSKKGKGYGISKEEMLKKLKDYANLIGHTPSMKELSVSDRSKVCCSAHYQQKFGSYNKAMVSAGLISNQQNDNTFINVTIDYEAQQVLLGSLMGDGALTKRSKNPRFRENHCIAQKYYLLWKKEKLNCLFPSVTYSIVNGNSQIHLCTKNLKILDEYWNIFYSPKKRVSLEILSKIEPLALAVWYMDDGTMHKWGYIRLATHCFGLEGNRLIQKWFIEKFNLQSKIYLSSKYSEDRGYSLYFSRIESTKFINLIKEYAHPVLDYKFRIKSISRRPNGERLTSTEYSRLFREKNPNYKKEWNRKNKIKMEKAFFPNRIR